MRKAGHAPAYRKTLKLIKTKLKLITDIMATQKAEAPKGKLGVLVVGLGSRDINIHDRCAHDPQRSCKACRLNDPV